MPFYHLLKALAAFRNKPSRLNNAIRRERRWKQPEQIKMLFCCDAIGCYQSCT